MKSSMDIRLECLRLATTLGTAKVINHADVLPRAMEFFRWVDRGDERADEDNVQRLIEKYGRR